jgi:isopenicillin-N N-acyltransferase-like protein
MPAIQVIELDQAQPRARGRAYGETARERIALVRATYEETFGFLTGQTWPELSQGIGPFVGPARDFAPDLMEEMEGIAQGAGLTFEDIFLLNARSEVMFGLGSGKPQGGCTTILALPPATAKGETLLAQNWDWLGGVKEGQVLLKLPAQEDRPALVTFTEAGQVAKLGMNGAGLALTVNNLNTDRPRIGVPWILICRKILEADRLTRAMGRILATPRAHSINFLLARQEGDQAQGVSLETAPVEPHLLWPQEGLLIHTNHFLETPRDFKDLKPREFPFPCTYVRYERARQALAGLKGRVTAEGLKGVLSDHFDHPHSICMHPNPLEAAPRRAETCLSVIFNLSDRSIHFCPGKPCQGEWSKLDLNQFLEES